VVVSGVKRVGRRGVSTSDDESYEQCLEDMSNL